MVSSRLTPCFLPLIIMLFSISSTLSSPSIQNVPPTASWMGQMATTLSPMTIPDMVLPGTHDTGTYNLTDSIERDPDGMPTFVSELIKILQTDFGISEPYTIIREWARTQRHNVYSQLLWGNRFLDIRVCWDGKNFRTEHLVMGDYTEKMLADVARFMSEQPNELLVLQFGAFNGMKDPEHNALIVLIRKYLGQWLWYRPWGWQSYSAMIAKGRRIVAFYDAEAYVLLNQDLWSSTHLLASDWADVDNYAQMVAVESASLVNMTGFPQHVYKLQWILTASARRVIDSVAEFFPPYRTLHDLSRDANVRFDSWLSTTASRYRVNILMVDWFDETDNVEQARRLNRMACNDDPRFRAPTPGVFTTPNCPNWYRMGLCSSNSTVASLCPLSCGLCVAPPGSAGDPCSTNSGCIYQNCHPDRHICLTDWPQQNGMPCGVDAQCQSGVCSNFRCIGLPVGAPCSTNATCGFHVCLNGACQGKTELLVIGKAPLCNVKPLDCNSDPRGLVYVAPISCDSQGPCLDGRASALCSTAILPQFQSFVWIGDGPFCGSPDCGSIHPNSTAIYKSKCGGGGGAVCVTGTKLLCGIPR